MGLWEKIKSIFVDWKSLLDQIPDKDRQESYRYDEILKKWVLLSSMPEIETPILDENRNLRVETPNFKIFEGESIEATNPVNLFYIKLDFLADSITVYMYDVVAGDNDLWVYYSINDIKRETFAELNVGGTDDTIFQRDCKPWNEFVIRPNSLSSGNYKWKIIFSKQKKTKISDDGYSESDFDGITDIGLSKNVFRDKIEVMISDVAYNESTWNAVVDIAPSKNAVRDILEAILTWLVSNVAYNESTWNGVIAIAPSKNAVRDWIESFLTALNLGISTTGSWLLKTSNDLVNFLEFYTSGGIPIVKINDGKKLYIESDDESEVAFRFYDGTYSSRFRHFKAAGDLAIQCSNELFFYVSGDSNDNIAFFTANNIPHIAVRGGSILYFRESVAGAWETLHADDFVNETPPMPTKLCIQDILKIKALEDGQLDKNTLPSEVLYEQIVYEVLQEEILDEDGNIIQEEILGDEIDRVNAGMKLGAMVLHLTKAFQELELIVISNNNEINRLNNEINLLKTRIIELEKWK